MTRTKCAPLLCLLLASMVRAASGPPEEPVRTSFTVLVGFPVGPEEGKRAVLLVPGTLIPLDGSAPGSGDSMRRQVLDRSLAFGRAAEKLWDTFRLDPGRRPQKTRVEEALPDRQIELPSLEEADVRAFATLRGFTEKTATFRIVFRQGDKSLADSTVVAARGGRAVVGAMDGAAAPYLFLFVEPDLPGPALLKSADITPPVVISKVDPAYPPEAKEEKVMGTVVLEATVGIDGIVTNIVALQDPDPRLTRAAADALRQWRFRPAQLKDGTPVAGRMAVTINFQLR